MENELKKIALDIDDLLDALEKEDEQAAMDAAFPHDSAALNHTQMMQTQEAKDSDTPEEEDIILDDEDEDEEEEPTDEDSDVILFDDPEEAIEAFNDIVDDEDDAPFELVDDFDDLTDLDLPPDILPGANQVFIKPEVDEERETTWEDDSDHGKFLPYLIRRLRSIPPHSGQTTVGCEKAISYLRKLDSEISKAIRSDEKNVIDETKAEELRDKIHGYIDQLEEAYEGLMGSKGRRKKKAAISIGKQIIVRATSGNPEYFVEVEKDDELSFLPVTIQAVAPSDGLTKEAHQLYSTVDPFLDGITRLMMKSHITQGKDLHNVYAQLHEQYDFTPREQFVIHELLLQKGLNLNVDLGRINEKKPNMFDGKNVEFVTEYFA